MSGFEFVCDCICEFVKWMGSYLYFILCGSLTKMICGGVGIACWVEYYMVALHMLRT